MRTLKLLVLAPFVVAAIGSVACGGGNSNDNPQVPTTDMSDAGMGSMDTTMIDSGASSAMSSATSAMDAATTTATDTSASAMDAATTTTTDTMVDAGVDAGKKGGKKGGKGGKKST